jgi:hypothetical protein
MDSRIIAAAQGLIGLLGQPAAGHAVWIHTELDDDTGERRDVIMCAIHPDFESKISVPSESIGLPVCRVPWQPDNPHDHAEWHAGIAKTARGEAQK